MAYTTIDKPDEYFNTKLYTGTGATNAQTSVGFQPDWVWIQNRGGTYANVVFDAVRGTTKKIEPQGTGAEATVSDTLTSFDSDGFTLGADSSSYCNRSSSPNSYVAWNWLASNTTASNTDGSITSTVSANTTSGFSIVSYTGNGSAGATIGHGLGVTPAMFIIKRRDVADGWIVYHDKNTSAPETDHLRLDTTSATSDDNTKFNDTAPTSSVFSVGSDTSVNGSSSTFITYCFAEKKGFSKFGSYTGNGNADGTFVYTGFKPAFFICKRTNATDDWFVFDNKREGYNVDNDELRPNSNVAEGTTDRIDILSNGIKHRNSGSAQNGSGSTYIYMAFAENPFVTSTGIPGTAR